MDLVDEILQLREVIESLKTELQTVKLTIVQMQIASNPTLMKAQKSKEGLLKSVLKLERGSTAIPTPTSMPAPNSNLTQNPGKPMTLSKKLLNLMM
jgi:hypothetical protein